jgi:hypothetical protein
LGDKVLIFRFRLSTPPLGDFHHVIIHTYHCHHISRIRCGACHHIHLGYHNTLPGGAPQSSIFDRLTPPVQDRLKAPQSGSRAQAQQDCQTTRTQRPINPAGGQTTTASNRTTKGDFIKIGTTDVIIQEDDKGSIIFDESASTNKKENTTVNKSINPKYSMPQWCPSGLTRSQKRKL